MIYQAYQTHTDLFEPIRTVAGGMAQALAPHAGPGARMTRRWAAACELLSRAALSHHRPDFGIPRVTCAGQEVAVTEEAALVTPFGTLLRFRKDLPSEQPRVLVVAPLSGHFATLLRGTVQTLLPENDVYITDWHNARDVGLEHGRFGLDEYTEHVIRFLEFLGPGAHVVAVCQPCVSALAAVAVMAEAGNPAQPRSLTLMAGPIDTRINPTKVNELATSKPIEWFERNLISTVPAKFAGGGRRVYPGFVQLSAFMSMNLDRHIKAHVDMYEQLAAGEYEKAQVTKDFYDEYFAVLDLSAEFYLETVRTVFQEYALPLGELKWRGAKVEPRAIRRTALLTIEGEKDDICALGQTMAAQDLCSGVRPYMKRHHMQAGVGHYGVFSGKRWQNQIYPIVRNTILASA
ncbi:MAG: polyhydroxyalkanoate depolymerase [Burkholderiales bacterium]|nr:polyhydroxyalkanoate depolymerase [Burkholderiales bacterium]